MNAIRTKVPLPVPTTRLLAVLGWLLLVAVVASILTATYADAWWVWAAAAAGLAALVLADALVAMRRLKERGWITVNRRIPHTIPVGVPVEVVLKISNRGSIGASLLIYDLHPASCLAEHMPFAIQLAAGAFVECRYHLTANERGDFRFSGTALQMVSPLGLWNFGLVLGESVDLGESAGLVRVFPNYAAVTRYALLAVDHRLSQLGVLKRRRRGDGMDFHQLRDYRDGDSPRSIDWKATSRRVKLISREYQDERDQQILFLLDCSRRMNAKDDVLSHFDHTLNAILLLTFVAIRQGDSAGLMTFGSDSNTSERFLAPKKAPETVSHFLNALYPLQPSLKTPDYYQAALDVGKRLNKRALIVVISNLRDEDEDGLDLAIAQLRRRHLVLFANLKEKAIEDTLHPQDDVVHQRAAHQGAAEWRDADLFEHAAALGYAAQREAVLARMRARGVRVLDVVPEQLPMSLVNRYLDLKQSGSL